MFLDDNIEKFFRTDPNGDQQQEQKNYFYQISRASAPGQLVKCFDRLHRDFGIFCKHETQALPNYTR